MTEKKDKTDRNPKFKESLTFTELKTVLNNCLTIEDRALIELGVTTGIRREDIVDIDIENVDLDKKRIKFWEEKKDRWYIVPIEPETIITLSQYIHTLPPGQRKLFDFSGRTAYRRLQHVLRRAGISKHIEFHGLRRSCMRLSKAMGRDIRYVMDLTGDTAETILREYEGYSIEEMNDLNEKDSIMKRVHEMRENKAAYKKWLLSELKKVEEDLEKIGR